MAQKLPVLCPLLWLIFGDKPGFWNTIVVVVLFNELYYSALKKTIATYL